MTTCARCRRFEGTKPSPAFSFYPNDWLGDGRLVLLTPNEELAYFRLIMYCWNGGGLPSDPEKLLRLVAGRFGEGDDIHAVIALFKQCECSTPVLYHARLDRERAKQIERSTRQSVKAKKRWDDHREAARVAQAESAPTDLDDESFRCEDPPPESAREPAPKAPPPPKKRAESGPRPPRIEPATFGKLSDEPTPDDTRAFDESQRQQQRVHEPEIMGRGEDIPEVESIRRQILDEYPDLFALTHGGKPPRELSAADKHMLHEATDTEGKAHTALDALHKFYRRRQPEWVWSKPGTKALGNFLALLNRGKIGGPEATSAKDNTRDILAAVMHHAEAS